MQKTVINHFAVCSAMLVCFLYHLCFHLEICATLDETSIPVHLTLIVPRTSGFITLVHLHTSSCTNILYVNILSSSLYSKCLRLKNDLVTYILLPLFLVNYQLELKSISLKNNVFSPDHEAKLGTDVHPFLNSFEPMPYIHPNSVRVS